MRREDLINVANYEFWDFDQEVKHLLYFRYRRIGGDGDVDDESIITELLSKIGLWEDFIAIKRLVKQEILGDMESEPISPHHQPNCFEVRLFTKQPFNTPFCSVYFSESESRRRTNGKSLRAPISIEWFKEKLLNLNKWLIYEKINK